MSTAPLQEHLQAQVLFEYVATDEDQLTIKPGEIVIIVDNSSDLNGWALAQKGDKEGYVPSEYLRYINNNSYASEGFESCYNKFLLQEHHLPFLFKMRQAICDVLTPFPCSRYGYVMTRKEYRTSAILLLIMNFIISIADVISLLSPIIFVGNKTLTLEQQLIVYVNILCRMILTLVFIKRYPRPNIIFCTFPFTNVITSLTYSIRYYEFLEIGEYKEYDGYRYNRTWMYCFLLNSLFEIISLIFVIMGMSGVISVCVIILTWNVMNAGRCYLGQWSNLEKGNDLHSDFEKTIEKYVL